MKLQQEWVEYRSDGQSVPAYLAKPARVSDPLPAVVVIQEVWGVDDHIQDVVLRVSTAGYLALAPDLYARGGRRPAALAADRIEAVKAFLDSVPPSAWMNPSERDAALARLPEPQRRSIGETLGLLLSPDRPMERYTADLRAGVRYLRDHPASRGRRVGSVGFCMGGALSALLACAEPELRAAVIYYGSAPPAGQIAGIRCPLLGLYGGDDPRITQGVPAFAEALRAASKTFEYHVFPGAPHAFFNDTRSSYRVDAARQAWARTLVFFAQHLAPV
jgi:carboxymethylenebutenolidase